VFKQPNEFGTVCVEVLRDPDLPFPRSKDPFFASPAVGHQPRDRFASFRQHNFLASSSFLDEPREMSLGSLNVEGLHLNQVWFSLSPRSTTIEEKKWEAISDSERNAMLDECFAYDDVLRKNGHFAGGETLQSPRNAITLRSQNGKVSITDGPYAETKEQLGGILVFEATDLNHAIELMSRHPGRSYREECNVEPLRELSGRHAHPQRNWHGNFLQYRHRSLSKSRSRVVVPTPP
jgi:hypothetical protein